PTIGGPWAELPLQEAIALLELRPGHFYSPLTTRPRFGDVDRDLWYAGYKHVVVEIGQSEGRRAKWKPGFYLSTVGPEEAFRRLIQNAVTSALGEDNVVRVEHEPSIDSQRRDALRITVVLAPGATARIKSDAALNALVRVQQRLQQMREQRTPIIQYAT